MQYTEFDEQCKVIQQWRQWNMEGVYPSYYRLYSTDASAKRTAPQNMRREQSGCVAGVCDLFLSVPNNFYHGLYIEMKAPREKTKGGKNPGGIKPEQLAFMYDAIQCGYAAVVCYTGEEAIEAIKEYLNG